mmetsp:Transcript_33769/g.97033  ORF Transcript_33769/g.97033 Transcript_33769/m.97033 type:complete len:297 (+) Transcript_33769:113-1003(+)
MANGSPMNVTVRNTFMEFIESDDAADRVCSPRLARRRSLPAKLRFRGEEESDAAEEAQFRIITEFARNDAPPLPSVSYTMPSSCRSASRTLPHASSPSSSFRETTPASGTTGSSGHAAFAGIAASPGAGFFVADTGFFEAQPVISSAQFMRFMERAQPQPGGAAPAVEAATAGSSDDVASLSIGSQGHATGDCRPCAFARSNAGCKFGASCRFCHIVAEHPESVRVRPCKGKRDRLKRQMDAIEKAVANDPDLLASGSLVLPPLVDRSGKARSRVMAQLSQIAADAFQERIVASQS